MIKIRKKFGNNYLKKQISTHQTKDDNITTNTGSSHSSENHDTQAKQQHHYGLYVCLTVYYGHAQTQDMFNSPYYCHLLSIPIENG